MRLNPLGRDQRWIQALGSQIGCVALPLMKSTDDHIDLLHGQEVRDKIKLNDLEKGRQVFTLDVYPMLS